MCQFGVYVYIHVYYARFSALLINACCWKYFILNSWQSVQHIHLKKRKETFLIKMKTMKMISEYNVKKNSSHVT